MYKLKDCILERDIKDIVRLAGENGVDLSDMIPTNEWELIFSFAIGDDNDRFMHYVELSREEDPFNDIEPDIKGKKAREEYRKYREMEKQILEGIRKVEHFKNSIAGLIADKMIDPETFANRILTLENETVELMNRLRDSLSEDKITNLVSVDLSGEQTFSADYWHMAGFVQLEETPAYENEDNRRHIVGIRVPDEVIEVYSEVYTKELDLKRRTDRLVYNCCYNCRDYYDVAPLEAVLTVYDNVRSIDPLCPELDINTFTDIARHLSDEFFGVFEIDGKNYILEQVFFDEYMEKEDKESTFFMYQIQEQANHNQDFYVPSPAEFLEYSKYCYWPGREGYRKLTEWVERFFMDEMTMNNMFPYMMAAAGMDDSYYAKDRYCMDDVDDDVRRTVSSIANMLMWGMDIEDVIEAEDVKYMTIGITDEAKSEFEEAMRLCYEQTNLPSLMGYMRTDYKK